MEVLEFVDDHGNEVLNLGSFTLLPQHVVRLILNREELKADEFSKFQVNNYLSAECGTEIFGTGQFLEFQGWPCGTLMGGGWMIQKIKFLSLF